MTLLDVLVHCAKNREFVAEFNRLYGRKFLLDQRQPIEQLIDKAVDYDPMEEDGIAFVRFVITCVWMPLIEQDENHG